MSYFVINKKLDYDRGFLSGGEFRDGRLFLKEDCRVKACFFSRLFDSREAGTEWGRFTADSPGNTGAGFQISFYAADQPFVQCGERKRLIADLVRDPRVSDDDKREFLKPLLKKRFVGENDVLLNGVCGRYLLFVLDLYRQEHETSCGAMCLYFPKNSWIRYLPGVYSQDREGADFTERFLGIFQTLYEDREREIRGSASFLNPDSCGRELLEELAEWHNLKDIYLWPDDRLRTLIRRAPELSRMRGTVAGLREYLRLYTGEEPVIREDENEPSVFSVGVKENLLADAKEYRSLLRVISHMKPAGMEVRVVPLRQRMQMGADVYLGLNSAISGVEGLVLDGTSPAGLTVLSGKRGET